MPLLLQITNEEKIRVTANPTTARGAPALLDGPLRVSVISGNGSFDQAALAPNEVYLVSPDVPGDTTYLIEGDTDLGAGVQLIQDTVTLQVTGALAQNLGLFAGPPEPK